MLKNKKFDCVQMKWDIQNKLQKEYDGLRDTDAMKKLDSKIKKDRILAEFYDKIQNRAHSHSVIP